MIKKNRFRLFSALAIALLLLIVAVAFFLLRPEFHRQTEDAEAEDYELQGVDLSAHNGNVDFSRMKEAGIDFVILKASEGNGFRDSRFEENYKKAVAGGLDVGAYHFFRFDVDGVEQAKNFMSTVAGKRFDLPLAIDVEEHGNPYVFVKSKVVRQLQNMIDELTANEYRIMIYTNKGGYEKFIRNNFDDYPLWICSFTLPESDLDWTIWQYSHWGNVEGVDGDVDLNLFYGNSTQWKQWID